MSKPADKPDGDKPTRSPLDRVRAIANHIATRPGTQLVLCGVLLAFLYPARSSGAIGMTVIGGALGVGVALAWPKAPAWLRRPPADITTSLVLTIVITAGVTVFWEALTTSPDWLQGDWGPQHAVLANIMPSLPGFDYPTWNHALSTGDAPLELYPAFTYLVTGHVASVAGLEHDLPHAMMIVAVITYLVIVAATTAIAMRVAPKPIALVVGLLTLIDSGAIAHGGTVGLFHWALFHSAMSLAFSTIAALGVIAALHRPRLRASVVIWAFTALAALTHPAGLIASAATILALAAVALLASDVPPRRALVAIGHVVLGVALGAAVWMPLAERILAYGQHFPNVLRSPGRLLEDLLAAPSPVTSYAMLGYAGYFGIIAGLWSRRASAVFVSASALVLLVGLSDAAYLAFDLAPGQGVARLGTERLAQLARPFVMAAGAFGIAVFVRSAISAWKDASRSRRLIAAALIGMLSAVALRAVPSVWWNGSERAANEAKQFAPDPTSREQLTRWAREQMATIGPTTWARAVFEVDSHEHMHLTAITGLPTFHNSWLPDLLLRERIEDLSAASLRRFNVRWAIAYDKSPAFGDPATEKQIGAFRIREIAEWDGKFARIEEGKGDVKVLRLDDRAVEIEVTGTTEPVLVVLGTGYYPRWRARHASGATEPVYAQPTIPDGRLHVVSAWVAPGKTTFTVDGPLPSDGKGFALTILAVLVTIAAIVAWSVRRIRHRILRRLARMRARSPSLARHGVRFGMPVLVVVLLVRGCVEDRGITNSLELGTGLRSTATVEARVPDGTWETCGYNRFEGVHYCRDIVTARDGMVATINDAAPSWGFNTPGIIVDPVEANVEVRIHLRAHLAGTYWTAASEGATTITAGDDEPRSITRGVIVYGDEGERDVEIRTELSSYSQWTLTFVHEDTLMPPRPFLDPPPITPPPEVRAIR